MRVTVRFSAMVNVPPGSVFAVIEVPRLRDCPGAQAARQFDRLLGSGERKLGEISTVARGLDPNLGAERMAQRLGNLERRLLLVGVRSGGGPSLAVRFLLPGVAGSRARFHGPHGPSLPHGRP